MHQLRPSPAIARVSAIATYAEQIELYLDRHAPDVLAYKAVPGITAEIAKHSRDDIHNRLATLLTGKAVGRGNENQWNPAVSQVIKEITAQRKSGLERFNRLTQDLHSSAREWATLDEEEVRERALEISDAISRGRGTLESLTGREPTRPAELKEDARIKLIRRTIRRQARQYRESLALAGQIVGADRQRYVSNETLRDRRQQLDKQRVWINATSVTWKNSNGETQSRPLAELYMTPAKRQAETLAVIAGLEELGRRRRLIPKFVTLTCQPEYHPRPANGSEKWNGSSPREAQDYLMEQWALLRASVARTAPEMIGLRVVEPHKDSTPHWHLMIWASERGWKNIERHMADKFGTEPAVTIKAWSEEGNAKMTSYMMKYIMKAVGKSDSKDVAADRVDAFRATWGIRSFSVFGIPRNARTVWKLARSASEDDLINSPFLTDLAIHARLGDFASLVEQLERQSISAIREPIAHLGDDGVSSYTLTRLIGLVDEDTGEAWIPQKPVFELVTSKEALAAGYKSLDTEADVTLIHNYPRADDGNTESNPPPNHPPPQNWPNRPI